MTAENLLKMDGILQAAINDIYRANPDCVSDNFPSVDYDKFRRIRLIQKELNYLRTVHYSKEL